MLRLFTNRFSTARVLIVSSLSLAVPQIQAQPTEELYPAVDCVIQPSEVVDLGSPVSGTIKQILVDRSDRVTKGEPVALIDDRVELATVELARARTKVDAQLEIEETNISYDRKSQVRADSLYERQAAALSRKDDADRAEELSELRLQQVKDLQEVRNRELERAEELVEQKIIRSTLDGFVVVKFKSQGEYIEEQPILRIAQLDPLNVEAILPMKYFDMIRPGMLAEVNPEMTGAALQSAQVSVVDRIGDTASGTFGVRLTMKNPDLKIPAGLKCDVKFLETPEHVITEATNRRKEKEKSGLVSTPVSAPVELKSTSFTLGPFIKQAEFESAREFVQNLDFADRQETVSEVTNYQVRSSPDSAGIVRDQIENGQLKDYRALNQPAAPGQYSLGVFSTMKRANRRLQDVAALGITAEVKQSTSDITRWWIDVVVAAGNPDFSLQTLKEKGFQVRVMNPKAAGS